MLAGLFRPQLKGNCVSLIYTDILPTLLRFRRRGRLLNSPNRVTMELSVEYDTKR